MRLPAVNVLNSKKIDSGYWRALFAADSVAVIGAKDVPGSWGYDALYTMSIGKGDTRQVYAVNPGCKEVLGYSCYDTILDIDGPVELAIIVVPAPVVPQVLRQCAEKKVKVAVIVTAGFGEVDAEGAKLEAELLGIARENGMHFVGPNCVGHADIHTRVASAGMAGGRTAGPMSIISQSGTLGANMMQISSNYGIGLSKFISTGNETDLHFEDYLEFLADDEETGIITAYIEGLREGRRFYDLAKNITFKKPIIVIKTGSTKESGRAAKSHTGALSGVDEIYSAAFRQAGVIRVDDEEEACGMVTAMLTQPLPGGRRVGILTMGGGFGVVTAETCEKEGLTIAPLEPGTIEKLDEILPSRWSHGNPVDLVGIRPAPGDMTTVNCLRCLLEDKNIDAVLTLLPLVASFYGPPDRISRDKLKEMQIDSRKKTEKLAKELKKYGKPLYMITRFSFHQQAMIPPSYSIDRIPEYTHQSRAARIIRRLAWYNRYLDTRK
jgi:acyl-CoA synthetase (NDP forming)